MQKPKFKLPKDQTVTAKPPKRLRGPHLPNVPTAGMLQQGGVMCFNAFVRECGYKDDARIPEWAQLKEHQKDRWRHIAKDVYAIMESNRISVESNPSA